MPVGKRTHAKVIIEHDDGRVEVLRLSGDIMLGMEIEAKQAMRYTLTISGDDYNGVYGPAEALGVEVEGDATAAAEV